MADSYHIAWGLIVAFLGLAAVLGGHALRLRRRRHRGELAMQRLAQSIEDYFRASGAEVRAECIAKADGVTILALIDSEPQARFRYSHIIEIGLRTHLLRLHGVVLARVYWRFAIREMSGLDGSAETPAHRPAARASPAAKPVEDRDLEEDNYLNQRHMHEKLDQEYQVGHTSWESFVAARSDGTSKEPDR